jgi:hypothetical protein
MEMKRVMGRGLLALGAITLFSVSSCGSSDNATHSGTGGVANSTGGTNGGSHLNSDPLTSKNSDLVFDDAALWRFDLTASDSDVAWLNANIRLEEPIPATLTANGHDIGQVGLKYKGSYGTLYGCLDDAGKPTCRKIGMKIVFNEYDDQKRFYGLKKLNFNSSVYDDSLMHERLGYSLFRDMGIYASRDSHALLYLNGEFLGVFSMIEEVDGRFTNNRFAKPGDGNLYKECWPTSADSAYYTDCLKTNEEVGDVSGMVAFGSAVLSASDADLPSVIEQYNDIDYLMRYLAVDRGIHADDGIMTFYAGSNHNYYWYQEENVAQFWLIPWDMYSTFSLSTPLQKVPQWDQSPGDCGLRYPSYAPDYPLQAPGCDKFIHGLALVDRSRYIAAVQQFLDGPFQLDAMNAKIDRWTAQIADAVALDTHGPSVSAFKNAVSGLRSNLASLRKLLEKTRDTPTSGITASDAGASKPMAIATTGINDFEGTDAMSFDFGSLVMSNADTMLSAGPNQTNPIDGTTDLRIRFEFRDQPGQAWQQWGQVRMSMAGGRADLIGAGIKAIRFKARADSNRALRFDIESPKNPETNKGVCIGWDVNLTTEAQEFVVNLDTGAIPSWRLDQSPAPPVTDRNAVYQNVTGLNLGPRAKGVSSDGFFPAGVTDPGFVEVDDISFVTP